MSAFGRWLGVSALCGGLLGTARADAATVAILSDGASPAVAEVTSRLRGELAALRLDVVLLRRPALAELRGGQVRAWLERTAESRGLDAAIEVIVESTTQSVDVWIFEPPPRPAQVARVFVEPDAPDRAGALAIRAIEVLRSSDLEAKLRDEARARGEEVPSPSPKPEPAPPRAETAPAAEPPRDVEGRLGLEVGAGLSTGLDGVGRALSPVLRGGWRLPPTWVAHATLSGLGTRPTLTSSSGTVRVGQSYAALGLCFCPQSGSVSPYVALAAGAKHVSLTGVAEAPARGQAVEQWSLLVDAGVGARWRWSGRFFATLTGHVQLTQPRVTIRVVDEALASTGRPDLALDLLVGAWL